MRFLFFLAVGLLLFLITGCSSPIQTDLASLSSDTKSTNLSPSGLLTPLADSVNSEILLGSWTGAIEWKLRKSRKNSEDIIPLAAQGPNKTIWSLKLSINQQQIENGERTLQGRATIQVSSLTGDNSTIPQGGRGFFFTGFVLVKIIKKVIIIRIILDDGTILYFKKCKIILIFRSFFSGILWGESRLVSCSFIFPDLSNLGSVRLEKNSIPILKESSQQK